MTAVRCPNCGAEVPEETGQHALTPAVGLVQCPTCGEKVTLPKAGADAGDEYFSGHETVEGVMQEIEDKEET
jgi:DNA-directed RNA polymerase subunit RPC12/RpoP